MENLFPTPEYVRDLENILAYYRYLHWVKYEFLSFPWTLLSTVTIVAVIVWLKLVDRKNLLDILLLGSWVAITCLSVDEFGCNYGLWRYAYHLIPQFPQILWVHFFIVPITYMLVYQYCPRWQAYLKTMVTVAAVFAFVGEPCLVRLGQYELLKWSYAYSFPLYVLVGVVFKGIIGWLKGFSKG